MIKKSEIIGLIIAFFIGVLSLAYDSRILLFIKSLENPWLSYLLTIFNPISMIFLFGLLIVLILIKERRRKLILPLVLTLIASIVISFILKVTFMRQRPFGLVKEIFLLHLPDYSFPSSHAVTIFSVLPILNKEFSKLNWFWFVFSCLIAFSRFYFQVHYLSDVILGAVIGYIIGLSFVWLEEKYCFGEKLIKSLVKK